MGLSDKMKLKDSLLELRKKKPSYTAKNFIEDFPEYEGQEIRITQIFNLIIADKKVTDKLKSIINS